MNIVYIVLELGEIIRVFSSKEGAEKFIDYYLSCYPEHTTREDLSIFPCEVEQLKDYPQ